MVELALTPHPDFPSAAVTSIEVAVRRARGGELRLTYRVAGKIEEVLWPDSSEPGRRTDNLWQHTCFEAFVGRNDEAAYYELNFATSGDYAVYRFSGYRSGMETAENVWTTRRWETPVVTFNATALLSDMNDAAEWHLNLSAVIEETDGTKSYWALAHAPGPPDFHNRDCFIATLPAPGSP